MRRILISAGHSNIKGRDRGAVGNGYIEGDLAVEFRRLLIKEMRKYDLDVYTDLDDSVLTETIQNFKLNVSSDTISIDIHWNAATPTATGTEVFIPDSNSATERQLAKDIADLISRTLDIPLRGNYKGFKGVKTESDSHHRRLGFMRLNGDTVLIEMCFISNKKDMEKYQTNKHQLAKDMAILLCEYSSRESNDEKVENIYIVVSGDSLSKIANKFNTSVGELKRLNNLSGDLIRIGQRLKIR